MAISAFHRSLRTGRRETSLRIAMYRRIVVSVLAGGFLVSACVFFAAEALFTKIYEDILASNTREAEDKLDIFDVLLRKIEQESLVKGRKALGELAKRYPTLSRVSSRSIDELSAEARELGVSEIYFIDKSGRILASSFAPDIGLDLFSLGSQFSSFLHKLYGNGVVVDQRLSQSTLTGTINSYQYFGPKNADFLIEVSSRLSDSLVQGYPGFDYDSLVKLAFDAPKADDGPGRLVRIIDLVSTRGISTWSLFQQKPESSPYASLVEKAKRGEKAVMQRGNSLIMAKVIAPERNRDIYRDSTFYAVLELDQAPLRRFRFTALLAALLACGISTALAFAVMRHSFDKTVSGRIERLRSDIERVAEGDYGPRFADYGEDEIGAIGASVASMVGTILEKEESLRRAQRMETVGSMAGGLAHDFGNVIAGISGSLECIRLGLADEKTNHDDLLKMNDLASKTAKRGGELVRSLLDIASQRPPKSLPVDLAAVAREAVELAKGKAEGCVEFRVEGPEDPLIIQGDAQAILRAALNLCVNGIQAMTTMRSAEEKRGGLLLVRAEYRPSAGGKPAEAAIIVRDEGVGIAEDEMSRVLTPFYSTKPRGIGTGLGLSIAFAVAESHCGRLEIASEPGRGSTFTLVLPA